MSSRIDRVSGRAARRGVGRTAAWAAALVALLALAVGAASMRLGGAGGAWRWPGVEAARAAEPSAGAGALTSALTAQDIDWERCEAWADDRLLGAAPKGALEALLGLVPWPAEGAVWSTGPRAGERRHFRVAFTRPVALGTVCTDYRGGGTRVSMLKPDAAYPGDLADEGAWTPLEDWSAKTLVPGTLTRALRFSHLSVNQAWENHMRESRMGRALLLRERAYAPSERGGATWSGEGAAATLTLHWPVELPIAGVALLPAPAAGVSARALASGATGHALTAPASAWAAAPAPSSATGRVGLLAFAPATTTRAIRLAGSGLRGSGHGSVEPLCLPLVTLADDQTPPATFVPPEPFRFAYEMPYDGFPSIRIRDAKGREVRRLLSEVPRRGGKVLEGWDLKDDQGRFVPPGTYSWYGLARPGLRLTYETTVYNAGQPPWLAPVKTLGWWMADHCPPQSIAAAGDYVFMGALGAEYGVPLIATDLEGNKVWHDWHQGAPRLCSDGTSAYVVTDDSVIRIDPSRRFAKETIHRFGYSDLVPGHGPTHEISDNSGVACFGGKLYVTYNAPETAWVRPSFGGDEIDFGRSFPRVVNERVHDTDLTPFERWTSAFQTSVSSMRGRVGEAARSGEMAGTIVVRLRRPAPIGSVVRPAGDFEVYALREGQALPAWLQAGSTPREAGLDAMAAPRGGGGDLALDPEGELDGRFDPKAWVRLKDPGRGRPGVAVPEQGLYTDTLVFVGRKFSGLDYALVLDRRYRDAAVGAKVVPLEGELTGGRSWRTARSGDRPISAADPCKAGIVWEKPVTLRGFSVISPMQFSDMAVDVWKGAEDATIGPEQIKDDAQWTPVLSHAQDRAHVKYNWHSPRMLIGDLGAVRSVRAFRVRVTSSPTMDRVSAGGFEAFVALEPLGGDVPHKPSLAQRVTVLDLPKPGETKVTAVRHAGLASPGTLTFDAAGNMLVASAKGIVRIEAGKLGEERLEGQVLVPREACRRPRGMAVDASGRLLVVDAADQVVKIFDAKTGAPAGVIGTPGGMAVGPYDPTRLVNPTTLALDRAGKVWVVESMFQPKRISRWSADGRFEKDFMGPTHYGGGGLLDPQDPSVINHLGMKFRVGADKKSWKLEARLAGMGWRNLVPPDKVTYLAGKRYLVGDGGWVLNRHGGALSWIAEEVEGVARPLVVAGLLRDWASFGGNAESLAALASKDASRTSVLWCDLNRDGKPQVAEVQVIDSDAFRSCAGIGEDLSLNFSAQDQGWKLLPTSIRADGLPLYEVTKIRALPGLTHRCLVSADGWTFVMGHRMIDPSGKIAWSYPDFWMSVQLSNKVPWGFVNRPAGVLAGGLMTAGVFKVGGETLYSVNANQGEVFLFTQDGLLVGTAMGGPNGYGRRYFAMPECEPGKTDLTDLRNTVEGFQAHISATPQGQVHLIAGKNHITLMRVDGLERMKRLTGGTLEVKESDLAAAAQTAARRAQIVAATNEPAVAAAPFLGRPPKIDGDVVLDWPAGGEQVIRLVRNDRGQVTTRYAARLAYDATNLYIAGYATSDRGMTHRNSTLRDAFLGGDALDVHLALDPKADPARTEPAAGDVRLVLSRWGGKTRATLMRPVAPGADPAGAVRYESPVGQTLIAQAAELADAKIAVIDDQDHWRLEAAVPWAALGVPAPKEKLRLRGDLGVLVADESGQTTAERYYWANRRHVVMGDQPSEARLHPDLWGEFEFAAPMASDRDFLGGSEAEADPQGLEIGGGRKR